MSQAIHVAAVLGVADLLRVGLRESDDATQHAIEDWRSWVDRAYEL